MRLAVGLMKKVLQRLTQYTSPMETENYPFHPCPTIIGNMPKAMDSIKQTARKTRDYQTSETPCYACNCRQTPAMPAFVTKPPLLKISEWLWSGGRCRRCSWPPNGGYLLLAVDDWLTWTCPLVLQAAPFRLCTMGRSWSTSTGAEKALPDGVGKAPWWSASAHPRCPWAVQTATMVGGGEGGGERWRNGRLHRTSDKIANASAVPFGEWGSPTSLDSWTPRTWRLLACPAKVVRFPANPGGGMG